MIKIGSIELGEFPLLLAPMEDVSDPPFRSVCKKMGADLMYTEFISSEGLVRDAQKSLQKLDVYDYERPIGIQLFGGELESMSGATRIADEANPDLIDINYGCPVKKVVCKMAGAGILKDIPLMIKLTEGVIKSTNKPVTVKTRLGWDENTKNIVEVAERLQDIGVQALSIHGRTRMQMYKGEADWTLIGAVKNNPRMKIPIFGNGDINSPQKALEYKNRYGVDGIMIGRAAIGYPWVFREIKAFLKDGTILLPPTIEERIAAVREHFRKSLDWKGEKVGVMEMRPHYANYLKNLPNVKPFRIQLVTTDEIHEIEAIFDKILSEYAGIGVEELVSN